MKNVMITGAAGFIGSNFVRHALTKHSDWNVIAYDKLTYAVTEERQYVIDYTISTLEEALLGNGFLRIHRSTLINLAFVEELHRWFGGRMIGIASLWKQPPPP